MLRILLGLASAAAIGILLFSMSGATPRRPTSRPGPPGVQAGGGPAPDNRPENRAVPTLAPASSREGGRAAHPAGILLREQVRATRDRRDGWQPAEPEDDPPLDRVNGPVLEGWHSNGNRHFEGAQVQDQNGRWMREGPWTAWHENGTLHELGGYRDDLEHGRWQWWYESGVRMAEGNFEVGSREGDWYFWHESGAPMEMGGYLNGKRQGSWTIFYDNGRKLAEGNYSAGEYVGHWTLWHRNGELDGFRSGRVQDGKGPDLLDRH